MGAYTNISILLVQSPLHRREILENLQISGNLRLASFLLAKIDISGMGREEFHHVCIK